MLKYIKKPFTNKQLLHKYNDLVKKSAYITAELFPRKLENPQHFEKYAKLKSVISKNITLTDQTPVDSINNAIFTPCWDLLDRQGKKWRPMLGLMVAEYYKFDIQDIEKNKLLYQVITLTELIHNASLIIDDIEDKSEQRRNKPCVHLLYGEDISINAGISLFFLPIYTLLQQVKDKQIKAKLSEAYFEEMTAIHLGQGWDIEMKIKNRIPSLDNYRDTVVFKSGMCPRLIVKLVHCLIENIEEDIKQYMIDLSEHLSIAFQIKDDLLNLEESELSKGKGIIGEDIYEGKLTLMIIHTLNSNNSNKNRLREILNMKTRDQDVIFEAIEIMRKNGSIAYAESIMDLHAKKVDELCDLLSRNGRYNKDGLIALKSLTDYLCKRNI
jgi:geranylgeranyl diphosphate synthase type 3